MIHEIRKLSGYFQPSQPLMYTIEAVTLNRDTASTISFQCNPLEVRIDTLPVSNCRDDAQVDDLVTHLAEVLV